jgi:hypothetical protein
VQSIWLGIEAVPAAETAAVEGTRRGPASEAAPGQPAAACLPCCNVCQLRLAQLNVLTSFECHAASKHSFGELACISTAVTLLRLSAVSKFACSWFEVLYAFF